MNRSAQVYTRFQQVALWTGPVPLIWVKLVQGYESQLYLVLAIAFWMVLWWVSEGVSLSVTALLPLLLLPFCGIETLAAAARPYASPIVFLFFGGFLLALGLERWNLHRRIALNLIALAGNRPRRILLSFMVATGFLSMWISNTATAVMMLPIAESVIQLIQQNTTNELSARNFARSILLGVAYSASIGGIATIIGTPPNVVMVAYMQSALNREISFVEWMLVGLPISLMLLTAAYLVLLKLFPVNASNFPDTSSEIKRELEAMGPMQVAEKRMVAVFALTAGLWIFREPLTSVFPEFNLDDTGIALLGGLLLFVLPANKTRGLRLLEWKHTERLPWGILLLFGGGLVLAGALEKAGALELLGSAVTERVSHPFLLIVALSFIALFVTELMSNVALVSIMVPLVCTIALQKEIDPLLLALPVTLAASCASMMPMSTPPNAIVFAGGRLTVSEMARAGFWANLVSLVIILGFCQLMLPYLRVF